jgi:enterochelin esterase-like enzyme
MIPDSIDWHKLEVSLPRLESDGLRFVTVKSGNLHGRGDVLLFVPPHVESLSKVPTVVLMHGIYGSSWGWAMKGAAHLTAARLIRSGEIPPMVLAMPSDGLWGDGSGYIKQERADFEAWIAADVPAVVRRIVPQTENGPLFLAGLSMGGFGALRLGAKFGKSHFQAVSAMSACTRLDDLFEYVTETAEDYGAVNGSCAVLDTMLANRNHLPAIRFDCGTEDALLEKNRALAKSLHAVRIAHTYEEFPGGHNWEYWETHLSDTLKFFAASSVA